MLVRRDSWLFAALLGASVALGVGACASTSQQQSSKVAQASGEEDEGGEEGDVVCRTERPTGSNIAKRVCYDRSELEDRSERDQQTLRESGRYGCEGGGCGGND